MFNFFLSRLRPGYPLGMCVLNFLFLFRNRRDIHLHWSGPLFERLQFYNSFPDRIEVGPGFRPASAQDMPFRGLTEYIGVEHTDNHYLLRLNVRLWHPARKLLEPLVGLAERQVLFSRTLTCPSGNLEHVLEETELRIRRDWVIFCVDQLPGLETTTL